MNWTHRRCFIASSSLPWVYELDLGKIRVEIECHANHGNWLLTCREVSFYRMPIFDTPGDMKAGNMKAGEYEKLLGLGSQAQVRAIELIRERVQELSEAIK